MAIQNVSTDGDGVADRQPEDNVGDVADNTDDDEISATPVMQTYSIKRDRTKLASSNKPSSTSRPVKNEPHAASPSGDVINGSPLRDRNRATVARTSNNNRPKPATDVSHGFVDVRADARRPKDGVRKVLTLSANRKRSPTTTTTTAAVQSPRVHQSVLDFKTSMSKDRKPLTVGRITDVSSHCESMRMHSFVTQFACRSSRTKHIAMRFCPTGRKQVYARKHWSKRTGWVCWIFLGFGLILFVSILFTL